MFRGAGCLNSVWVYGLIQWSWCFLHFHTGKLKLGCGFQYGLGGVSGACRPG